ncbi:MAG: OmpH family outer membrane protein, partial [Candidatus Eremiobacteraeota bacterium]|nr:OmpH family outer membrane protein [Candidatus Eremiobacteraeota bacterium]
AVSAKRKLSVVVDRHIVVYGGQDITTDVLNLVTGTQAIPPVTATPAPSPIGYVDQSVLDNGLPKVKAANDAFAKFAQQQRAIFAAKMQKATTNTEKQQISVEFNKVLANEQTTLLKPLVSKVRAITATIAEKKNLLVVVDKGDIVFGGTDITQDVRNGLNH